MHLTKKANGHCDKSPPFNSYHSRWTPPMCRLVIGTPCPDCVATMTALKLDLGVITHNDFFAGGA